MSNVKRIFIIGQSGAGKGVLAQALAKELGWKFIDADFSIEPSLGRTMDETLGTQGKTHFAQSLSEILAHQTTLENIVVTTDDSIICDDKNQKILGKEYAVHLKVSIPVQMERIGHNRPLLPSNNFKGFLEKLHQERNDLFEKAASFSLSSDDGNIKEHVAMIIKAMKG